MEPTSLVLSPA